MNLDKIMGKIPLEISQRKKYPLPGLGQIIDGLSQLENIFSQKALESEYSEWREYKKLEIIARNLKNLLESYEGNVIQFDLDVLSDNFKIACEKRQIMDEVSEKIVKDYVMKLLGRIDVVQPKSKGEQEHYSIEITYCPNGTGR